MSTAEQGEILTVNRRVVGSCPESHSFQGLTIFGRASLAAFPANRLQHVPLRIHPNMVAVLDRPLRDVTCDVHDGLVAGSAFG